MKRALLLLAIVLPAFSVQTGAPIRRTGAPGDGVCTACHTSFPLNPEGGSVTVQTSAYKPGIAQRVRVTVSHPQAQRWGFEITARLAKDLNQQAGMFSTVNSDVQLLGGGTYATHTSEGTLSGGANGAKTFELEYTPPTGAEDGDIVFYAAGNAANNNNQPTGDRIYTTSLRVQPDNVCTLTQRPTVLAIRDAAALKTEIAPNSLVSIFGNNLSASTNARTAHAGDIRDNSFPKELSCMAVEVNGKRAPITHVQRDQINAQIPDGTPIGTVQVRVIANADRQNAVTSDPGMITISNVAPAFFTFNGTSVAAFVLTAGGRTILANETLFSSARPARPGEIVELYATGLGPTTTAVAAGALNPPQAISLRDKLTVTIGGTTLSDADVFYAGLAPGNISGLYQVNVRVPANASNGDLPITMATGGVQSPSGSVIPVRAQ